MNQTYFWALAQPKKGSSDLQNTSVWAKRYTMFNILVNSWILWIKRPTKGNEGECIRVKTKNWTQNLGHDDFKK